MPHIWPAIFGAVDDEGWEFDTDNEGGWGLVVGNAAGPNGYSLQFDTGASDAPIGLTGDGGVDVISGSPVNIDGGDVTLQTNGGVDSVIVTLQAGPGPLCKLAAAITQVGGTFTVKDSGGNPILQLTG